MQLSDRLYRLKATHWVVIYGLICAAWLAVLLMGESDEMRQMAKIYGADFWAEMCGITPDLAGYLRLVLMWAIMAAAMMLPAMIPSLAVFDDLAAAGAQGRGAVLHLAAGYLIAWVGFSVLAAGAQMALVQAGLVTPLGQSLTPFLNAGLMAVAGAYQLSRAKSACLSKCRDPLVFFVENWQPGRLSALWLGVRLGGFCIGCCWALMLLGFVGGMMSLLWMGAATAFVIAEKMPWADRSLPFASGLILLGAGAMQLGAAVM